MSRYTEVRGVRFYLKAEKLYVSIPLIGGDLVDRAATEADKAQNPRAYKKYLEQSSGAVVPADGKRRVSKKASKKG